MFVVFRYKVVFKMAVDKLLRLTSLRAFTHPQIRESVKWEGHWELSDLESID